MPIYSLIEESTGKETEINCSYNELEAMISTGKWERKLVPPNIVSGVGSLRSRVPDGFRDRLNQIKKGSTKNNTIET